MTVAVVPASSSGLSAAGLRSNVARLVNPGLPPVMVPDSSTGRFAGFNVKPDSIQLLLPRTRGPSVHCASSARTRFTPDGPSRQITLLWNSSDSMPSNNRNTVGVSLLGWMRTIVLLTKR